MPAFMFEKISPPPRAEAAPPPLAPKRRGRFARLVDRLAEIRLQSYDVRTGRLAKKRKSRLP